MLISVRTQQHTYISIDLFWAIALVVILAEVAFVARCALCTDAYTVADFNALDLRADTYCRASDLVTGLSSVSNRVRAVAMKKSRVQR